MTAQPLENDYKYYKYGYLENYTNNSLKIYRALLNHIVNRVAD